MIVCWTLPAEGASPAGRAKSPGVEVGALFDTHGAFILRSLWRLLPDPSMAEDIAQEVFLIAHCRRHELDAERNVAAWLYRVAVNVAWRHRRTFARRARLRASVESESSVRATTDPETLVRARDHTDKVHRCLQQLPRAQREVFILFELEEKTGDDVADLLGIPVATVWTRLHRARARFREMWLREGGGDA